MAITQERKNELINEFKTHESDTGSAEVQIAVLTESSARRGLLHASAKAPGRRPGR
jgi:ribosomal protein S15